ncbi:major facilitator superfamily domain-containing protein [Lanmaoa asiatica]|nr:major facilitator superfamily domain-containing protein [Lanmaoa asiatica]
MWKRTKDKKKAHDQAQAQASKTALIHFRRDDSKERLLGSHCEPSAEKKEGTDGQAAASSTFWFKVRLLAALLLPVFLETLDYTSKVPVRFMTLTVTLKVPLVVATAQPRIASVFNALSLQRHGLLAFFHRVSSLSSPQLADVFGRYSGLQLSLLFFLVGSAISTGAVNMAMMLIGRGIAGIGAAGLLTIVRTILSDSRSLDDNNWQTTILFLLYSIGFAIGPLIGGYLVAVSFRWVFAINLPICVVSIVLCHLLLRKKVKGGQPSGRLVENYAGQETFFHKLLRIDWIGTFLFIAGGILVLLALNWGSTDSWSSVRVILSWVLGPLLIITCLLWEHVLERQLLRITPSRHKALNCDPMLPLEIFRSYNVCVVMYGSFVSGMVMLVMFYFVSIFMTIVVGKNPAEAGIQLVYFAPGVGAGSLVSIRMIQKLRQPKYPILLGSLILPISLGLMEWAMGGTVGLAQCSTVVNAKIDDYLKDLVASGSLTGPAAAAVGLDECEPTH